MATINCYHESHHSTPRFWFGKKNPHFREYSSDDRTLYFGIEYEFEFNYSDSNLDAIAGEMLDAMGRTEGASRITIEHDGSLDYGFETISQPVTFGCLKSCFGYEKLFEIANNHHALKTGEGNANNGMHVHVSRAALGNTTETQELCITKLVYLLHKFRRSFSLLAGRDYTNCRWCSPVDASISEYDRSKVAVKKMKDAYDCADRYHAINLTNSATVELRIFAVDNTYETFLARVEFVHWLVNYCKTTTIDKIYALDRESFKALVRDLNDSDYSHFKTLADDVL